MRACKEKGHNPQAGERDGDHRTWTCWACGRRCRIEARFDDRRYAAILMAKMAMRMQEVREEKAARDVMES